MSRRLFLICLVLLLLACPSRALGVQVIIVNETEQYVPAAVTSMQVSGDVSSGGLSFVMHGYTLESGKMARVYVAGPASRILVSNVVVNGKSVPVFFDEKGYYFVVDESPFMATGMIYGVGSSSSTTLFFPGPINSLSFDLSGGYPVGGSTYYGVVNRSVTIQLSLYRHVVQTEGVMRYSFAPGDNEYYYVFNIQSYGGTIGKYEIPLVNRERQPSVSISVYGGSGSSTWHVSGDRLVLEIPAERATVTVSGLLSCTDCSGSVFSNPFSFPVKMVVSSDPELEMGVGAYSAVELDVSESPVPPKHPNGRVFLVRPDGYLGIELAPLPKIPSLAATVDKATYTLAYTSDGSVLVDASYRYKNTGLDYLRVSVPGIPLYASTQGSAIKLTTKEGDLYLALPKSPYGTSVEYMYFSSERRILPVDLLSLPLPNIDVPITEVDTKLYLPGDYYVLWVSGGRAGSDLPSLSWILVFSLVTLGFGLTLSRDRKVLALYYLASLGIYAISPGLYALWLGATGIPFVKRHLPKGVGKKLLWGIVAVGVLVALFAGGIFLVSILGSSSMQTAAEFGAYEVESSKMLREMPLVETKNVQLGEEGGGKITVQLREGVKPVKMEIPQLSKLVVIRNHLVTAENPLHLSVLVVSRWLLYLLCLASFWALYRLWPLVYGAYRSCFGGDRKSQP